MRAWDLAPLLAKVSCAVVRHCQTEDALTDADNVVALSVPCRTARIPAPRLPFRASNSRILAAYSHMK